MAELTCNSCVRGFHVYKEWWEAPVGEELRCSPQENNTNDHYVVSVIKNDTNNVVGHLPRKISRICWHFLKKSGACITCVVNGTRRYSGDLPQSGLEIPVKLTVNGREDDVINAYKLLQVVPKVAGPACSNIVYIRKEE